MNRFRDFLLQTFFPFLLSRSAAQRMNRTIFRVALIGMGVGECDPALPDERNFLRRLKLCSGVRVVMDVGANRGQYATIARSELPDATIYSFEPHPVSFQAIVSISKGLNIRPMNVALGATPGTIQMFDHANDGGSEHATVVSGVIEEIHGTDAKAIGVDVTTVDRFMEDEAITQLDLLKIDVEGFELEVLKGAARAIEESRISAMQLEFTQINALSGVFVRDISRILPGYRLFRLLHNGDLLEIGNIPAVRRELFGYQNLIALTPTLCKAYLGASA
jgi:FkbM family methyltransferase